MPSIKFELPEELMRGLDDISREFDQIMDDTLTAGAEVVEKRVRSNLAGVIGKNLKGEERSTGQLVNSLGISPCKNMGDKYNVKVGFNEPRSNDYEKLKAARFKANPIRAHATYDYFSRRAKRKAGLGGVKNYSFYVTTNAMIASTIEYGKRGQTAKPFMKPAERAVKKDAVETAQKKFVEIVEGKLKNGG